MCVYESPEELSAAAARELAARAEEAIEERGRFVVVLAGGSTPKAKYSAHISHPPSRKQIISSALDSEEPEDVLLLPGEPVNQPAPRAGSQ